MRSILILTTTLDSHPDYNLIIAANRDEFYQRATAPASFWADAPGVLAGRDLKEGGTWLGIDRQGRFAAITNYRQGQHESPASRSRGRLVSDYLTTSIAPSDYVERVRGEGQLYNGFNLLVGRLEEVFYYSNREGQVRKLGPGIYGLSNHLLDTPWPKVTTSKSALRALLDDGASHPVAPLFELLSSRGRPRDDLLPSTGIGPEWERLLSAAFIISEDYGTRSSTVVLLSRDGRFIFEEHSFGPRASPGGTARFEFQRGFAGEWGTPDLGIPPTQ